MTFSFEKERLTAISGDGIPMGHIAFPQVTSGLVNISRVETAPGFRGQGVAEAMMEALLGHLSGQNRKAVLTCPFAQRYVSQNGQWKHILPGSIHVTRH